MEKKYTTSREFPVSEYEARYKKAKKLMEERKIDALLLTQRENVEYFSGFLTHLWEAKYRPFVAILPRDGNPALILPRLERVCAEKTSWIKDLRIWEDPSDTYDRILCANLVAITVKDLGLAESKIGVESGYDLRIGMPLRDFNFIMSSLPEAKFVDAWDVIWGCRMFKSKLEREKIKKATDITCKGTEEAFRNLRSGMTEVDLHRLMCLGFFNNGADEIGFCNVRVSTDPWRAVMANSFAYDVKIKDGDLLFADVGAKYGGYFADQGRMGWCGKPPAEIKKRYAAAAKATDSAIEAMAPGVKISDIFQIAVDTLRKETGEVPPMARVGHGLGMDIHEPPNVGPKMTITLEPGMIITIEPEIFSPKGAMFAEDVIAITETGHEDYTYIKKEFYLVH